MTESKDYEWKTHSDHEYNWGKHSDHSTRNSTSSSSAKSRGSSKSKRKDSKPVDATSTPTKPFKERSQADQKLLLHQASALLLWLESQGLQKSAVKLRKGLEKDLGNDVEIPDCRGTWQFVKAEDYDTDDSSSSGEEESSSGDSESSSEKEESSSGEYESSSEEEATEYEEDMSNHEEEEEEAPKARTKATQAEGPKARTKATQSKGGKKMKLPPRAKSLDSSDTVPKRGVRRSVSFDESTPKIHPIPARATGEEKKLLYYDKHDIRRMRKEDAALKQEETEAELQAAMKEASANFGFVMPITRPF